MQKHAERRRRNAGARRRLYTNFNVETEPPNADFVSR